MVLYFLPFSKPIHMRVGLAQGNEDMRNRNTPAARYWNDLRGSHLVRCDNRDAKTQRIYAWERAAFQYRCTRDFKGNREAAKGFARLCLKIALKRLKAIHGVSDELLAVYRKECSIRFASVTERFCCGGTNGVFFANWGWVGWTIAHEIAHFIDAKEAEYTSDRRAGHGTDWLGWYRFLLVEACGFNREYVDRTLDEAKLRYRSI
jgi:hypothetical protein